MAEVSTVLLTGASGVVGMALVSELQDVRVVGLVHRRSEVPGLDEAIQGDLSQPRLGLSEREWRRLADEVDAIVHSGALTAWGRPPDRYEAINVHGTGQVVELARAADAPVHLISTCFMRPYLISREDELGETNVVKPYVHSKHRSERVLLGSGVPCTIYRPTNLVGSSRTGASSEPQIVQKLSEWIARGKAPYFPVHPGNRVDVVPVDVLAASVAQAVTAGDLGSEYWVTYGARAMTVEDATEVLVEHARSLGRDVEPAPVVDPREPLPIPLEEIEPLSRTFLKVLIDVSEVTHASGGVLPSSLDELADRYELPDASDIEAFRLSLEYWAGTSGATTH
jgi:nucleoside-diphosphate-sugar epimerase